MSERKGKLLKLCLRMGCNATSVVTRFRQEHGGFCSPCSVLLTGIELFLCHLYFTILSKQCAYLYYTTFSWKIPIAFGSWYIVVIKYHDPSPKRLYHFGIPHGQILWNDVHLLVSTITSFLIQGIICSRLPQLLNYRPWMNLSQGWEK